MKKILFTLLFLFLITSYVNAAPSIDSTIGDVEHGLSLTLNGSNFGTKTTAAPLVWDNFESGTDGNNIDGANPDIGAAWGTVHGTGVYSNTQTADNSLMAAMIRWVDPDEQQDIYQSLSTTGVYIRYERYMIPSDESITNCNVKQYYLTNFATEYADGTGMTLVPGGGSSWAYYDQSGDAGHTLYYSPTLTFSSTNNGWHTWEFYNQYDIPYSADNGVVKAWVDGVQYLNNTTYDHSRQQTWFTGIELGEMYQQNQNPDLSASSTCYVFYDNVYIDNTQSRVEIGNASTYADCSNREIQIPHHWSDSAVGITVNQGSFATDDEVYIWVIDSDGNISDQNTGLDGYQGYAITIGGEATDSTPPSVSGRAPAPEENGVALTSDIVFHVTDAGDGVDQALLHACRR